MEAERVIKSMNKVVAGNTDTSGEVVATRSWRRVSIDILRGNCRSFHRRLAGKLTGDGCRVDPYGGLSGLLVAAGI